MNKDVTLEKALHDVDNSIMLLYDRFISVALPAFQASFDKIKLPLVNKCND